MNLIKSALLVAAGIFVGATAITNIDRVYSLEAPVQITSNPGGAIFEFIGEYNKIRVSGQKVEIRGVCASACTFFLGMLPKEQVCYDDFARLGFHGVYSGGFMSAPKFNQPMTEWTYKYTYTEEVIKELEELGWSMEFDVDPEKHPTNMIWTGPEFLENLGYAECD